MLDPDAPPRHPAIAAALGPVRGALRAALGQPAPGVQVEAPRVLLVACSGGPDSVAALGLLTILRRSEGLALHVGHVDHGLRPASADEARLVAELAAGLGLPHSCTRLSLEAGAGLPARARAARRAALEAQRRECGAQAVVLAHTATDQAETMLMHMTRGAGLEGLAAMRDYEAPWLRPLLQLEREATRALCGHLDLPFVDDPTNRDTEALRIWLRERLLPRLRQDNPRFEAAMLGLARQAGDAEAALLVWAGRELRARLGQGGAGIHTLELAGFDGLPRAVRTRVLRQLCAIAGVDLTQLRHRIIEGLDAAAVAVARAQAQSHTPRPAPRRFDLHPGRQLEIDKNGLRVGPKPN